MHKKRRTARNLRRAFLGSSCLLASLAFGCVPVDEHGDALDDTVSELDALELAQAAQLPAPLACDADEGTFYTAPTLEGKADGALLKCRKLTPLGDLPGYDRYRVMYKSSTLIRRADGQLSAPHAYAATGEVYVPTGEAVTPSDRPVLASMHGLTGVRAQCAPSRGTPFGDRQLIAELSRELASSLPSQGRAVLVVPDLLGLGAGAGLWSSDRYHRVADPWTFNVTKRSPFTNVTHSYVSIEAQGRAGVDIVRAARSIAGSGLSASPRWFAVGESQGGHGALSVGEVVQRGYGSELRLRGVIAGAPGSALDDTSHVLNPVKAVLIPNVIAGLSLEWPELRPSQLLSNNAMLAFEATSNTQCLGSVDQAGNWMITYGLRVGSGSITRTSLSETMQQPVVSAALRANSPGHAPSAAPVFVAQVDGDPFVARQRTDNLVTLARTTNGGKVTYCVYDSPTTLSDPPLDPSKWGSWWSGVANNHHPLTRSFGKSPEEARAVVRTCSAPDGGVITPAAGNAALWHPVHWAKQRYVDR